MRTQHAQLLGFEHHMPVHPGKERQQTVVVALNLAQLTAEQGSNLGLRQVEAGQKRPRAEQRRRRRRSRRLHTLRWHTPGFW